MKTPKIKNIVNERGGYICGGLGDKGCGKDAGIPKVIEGYAYCAKCYKRIKGGKKW